MITFTKKNVRKVVVGAINEILAQNDCKSVTFDDDICPVTEIAHFDSLNGFEAGAIITNILGLPDTDRNLFFNETETRALRISEITEILENQLSQLK